MKLIFPILIIVAALRCSAQDTNTTYKIDNHTVFFIDSQRVEQKEINKYSPVNIASVNVLKGESAVAIIGPDGQYGVVFVETKAFARSKYTRYLKSKSTEYAAILNALNGDSLVQYFLNGRLLKENFEGDLSLIDDKRFVSLKIVDKAALQKEYAIKDKVYGVFIVADMPKNWFHD